MRMRQSPGFIGLGLMGLPMAKRLVKTTGRLAVHNRTKDKAKELLHEGATWCDTPSGVASQADVVFSMVSDPAALRSIALGPSGIFAGLPPGGIHVDTSTVSSAITRELAETYREHGCHFLHAPVLGSVPHAADGALLMFVGGDDEAYEKAEPYLKILSQQRWRFEHPEQASSLKLICNLFIAGMITTLGQALVFAGKADVDERTVLDVIGQSQMGSPMYRSKGTSILDGNFAPRFYLEHMLKDINLMVDAAREVGAPLPTIEVARELFLEAERAGFGHEDYSAVVKAMGMMKGRR